MKKLVPGIAATTIVILAACGGNVVVDDAVSPSGSGSGGSGGVPSQVNGAGGATSQSGPGGAPSQVNGAGGASCFNLPDPATLTVCSSTAGTGAGTISCATAYCDARSNTWQALCQGDACQCTLNDMLLCTCALTTGHDACSGSSDCCFHR